MADDDYNRAHEEGRSGNLFSGGDSIDYAGYMAGRDARHRAELSTPNYGSGGGSGSGGTMDLKGKAMQFGLILGVLGIPIGTFREPSVLGAVLGFGIGMAVGVLLRLGIAVVLWPFKPLFQTLAFLPAVLLGGVVGVLFGGAALGLAGSGICFGLWLVRRRMAA